jgi:hypothetical protein
MRARACLIGVLLTTLPSLAGCQRLNEERSYNMDALSYQTIEVPPPRYEQKVSAQVNAKGSPVSAYLVRENDKAEAEKALSAEKAPPNVLASKENGEEFTLEGTVPAGTGYILFIKAGPKRAEVKVKLTGR